MRHVLTLTGVLASLFGAAVVAGPLFAATPAPAVSAASVPGPTGSGGDEPAASEAPAMPQAEPSVTSTDQAPETTPDILPLAPAPTSTGEPLPRLGSPSLRSILRQERIGKMMPGGTAETGGMPAGTAMSPQVVTAVAASATAPADKEGMVQLTFPENVEVWLLIEYVSKRSGVNIIYDQAVMRQRVTISSPVKIPESSLMGLLESVLKMVGMALVDTEQPGWKKVVPARDLLTTAPLPQRGPEMLSGASGGVPITQIIPLKSLSGAAAEPLIRPLLSQPGGNLLIIPGQHLILITDYAANLKRIAAVLEMADKPGRTALAHFVRVTHVDAESLARQVTMLLKDKADASDPTYTKVTVGADQRTNQVIIIAPEGAEAEALELIAALDVASETAESSNIGFYKLVNSSAKDVLVTLQALNSGDRGLKGLGLDEAGTIPSSENRFTGPNNPPAALGGFAPVPPSYQPPAYQPPAGSAAPLSSAPGSTTAMARPASSAPVSSAAPASAATIATETSLAAKTREALITADINTNSIIIVAPPAVQRVYKELIARLDKRRPQVMLEITLVTIDTSNGFTLGVELSKSVKVGDSGTALGFSSFGLSTVDVVTGALKLIPGSGFNGVLLDPDTLNAVVQAVATNKRARVLSAPKVLVNDNATATLSSIAEAPYTSLNASDTVSTTSFAGYASAGTTITVTPHISEGDHLQLKYGITLNSFTAKGTPGIPPPRASDIVNSEVTVPDGYTVIVGGLTRHDDSDTNTRVPGLGDVPYLGYLFSLNDQQKSQSTLFVFIRPVVLRDDRFDYLKFLSERDLDLANLPSNYPVSVPILME